MECPKIRIDAARALKTTLTFFASMALAAALTSCIQAKQPDTSTSDNRDRIVETSNYRIYAGDGVTLPTDLSYIDAIINAYRDPDGPLSRICDVPAQVDINVTAVTPSFFDWFTNSLYSAGSVKQETVDLAYINGDPPPEQTGRASLAHELAHLACQGGLANGRADTITPNYGVQPVNDGGVVLVVENDFEFGGIGFEAGEMIWMATFKEIHASVLEGMAQTGEINSEYIEGSHYYFMYTRVLDVLRNNGYSYDEVSFAEQVLIPAIDINNTDPKYGMWRMIDFITLANPNNPNNADLARILTEVLIQNQIELSELTGTPFK